MPNNWFEVDKVGLGQLMDVDEKGRLISELVQNALDEEVANVEVNLDPVPGRSLVQVRVTDDSPEGFKDLADAYTLFAASYKKVDATKRGRFNLGEKLVLSLCVAAKIATTTGTIEFQEDGRRVRRKAKREAGSEFCGELRLTRAELDMAVAHLRKIIVPPDVRLVINGEVVPCKQPIETLEASLDTLIADDSGVLRTRVRKTIIEIYETLPGERAALFEMGMPVVETGDRWHVNVLQKVPLTLSRDNIPPRYLKQVRVYVLNAMHEHLRTEDANSEWVQQATSDPACSDDAIESFLTNRFGVNRAAYDPSDTEAVKQVQARGGTVITGSMLSKEQWRNSKRAGAVKPAGHIYPSPKPYSDDPNAPMEDVIDESDWTAAMVATADYARMLARELMDVDLQVKMTQAGNSFLACYGHCELTFNVQTLGGTWFDSASQEEIDALLIHEFGHHYSGDHLSQAYYDALCLLGAHLKRTALERPYLFSSTVNEPQAFAAATSLLK